MDTFEQQIVEVITKSAWVRKALQREHHQKSKGTPSDNAQILSKTRVRHWLAVEIKLI